MCACVCVFLPFLQPIFTDGKWKSTQRRCKHCTLAVVRRSQIFSPSRLLPDSQNLISWRWSLPSPIDPVWWDRCTQFQVIVVTDPQTQTDRGDYNILRRSLARNVSSTYVSSTCHIHIIWQWNGQRTDLWPLDGMPIAQCHNNYTTVQQILHNLMNWFRMLKY